MMQKIQEQFHKAKTKFQENTLYIIIGFYAFFGGIAFLTHKPPFYYPPQFKTLMNAPVFHWILIIFGLLLIIYSFSDLNENKVTGLLIGTIAGLTVVICLIQSEHLIFRGDFGNQLVDKMTILFFIFWIAKHWSKR